MSSLCGSIITGVLIALVTLCVYIYRSFTQNFDYWKKRNVPYCKPTVFFGNFKDRLFFRKALGEVWLDLYNELKGHKLGGVWLVQKPILLIRDPEIIKTVLIKEFSRFPSRATDVDEKKNPLAAHLFNLNGPKWRSLRTKLTPTFSPAKLKILFPLMKECAEELVQFVSEEAVETREVEFKEAFAKFATDVIGTCAFGLTCNSMKDPDSEFRAMGRKAFARSAPGTLMHVLSQVSPWLAKYFRARTSPTENVHDFFLKVINETVEYREKTDVQRNDFLQLLMEIKKKGKIEDDNSQSKTVQDASPTENGQDAFALSNNALLAAQAHVFFLAGFETSSTAMSFALHELSVNPAIQERLRNEIDNVLKETGGELTYEAIQKMEYLEQVINESLRKYPPVVLLVRVCNETWREPETGVVIEKGTPVQIPVYALHHDPEYYPDPQRFDPDRFSDEQRAKRPNYTFLPFGEGPKICIGLRFALLEAKLALAALLARFEVAPSARTPHPVALDTRGCITGSDSGIWVRLVPRDTASSSGAARPTGTTSSTATPSNAATVSGSGTIGTTAPAGSSGITSSTATTANTNTSGSTISTATPANAATISGSGTTGTTAPAGSSGITSNTANTNTTGSTISTAITANAATISDFGTTGTIAPTGSSGITSSTATTANTNTTGSTISTAATAATANAGTNSSSGTTSPAGITSSTGPTANSSISSSTDTSANSNTTVITSSIGTTVNTSTTGVTSSTDTTANTSTAGTISSAGTTGITASESETTKL